MSCISLQGTQACPEFAGFAVANNSAGLSLPDLASFDAYIAGSVSVDTTVSSSFGSGMHSAQFGCTGWDGSGLRYHQSAICAAFVALSTVNAQTQCNPVGTSIPLCQSTMTAFIQSYQSVITNTQFCPNPTAFAQGSFLDFYKQSVGALSTATSCLLAETVDRANCGFRTATEATAYCATSAGSLDACCSGTFVPGSSSGPSLTAAQALFSQAPACAATCVVQQVGATSVTQDSVNALCAIIADPTKKDTLDSGLLSCVTTTCSGNDLTTGLTFLGSATTAFPKVCGSSSSTTDTTSFNATVIAQAIAILGQAPTCVQPCFLAAANATSVNVAVLGTLCAAVTNTAKLTPLINNLGVCAAVRCNSEDQLAVTSFTNKQLPNLATLCPGGSSLTSLLAPIQAFQEALKPNLPNTLIYASAGAAGGLLFVAMIVVFVKNARDSNKEQDDNSEEYEERKPQQQENYGQNVPMQPLPQKFNEPSINNSSQYSRPVSSGKDVHPAVYNYIPMQGDELAANQGDMIIVKASYDDGWAYGFNTRSMAEGFFPLGILAGFAEPAASNNGRGNNFNNRTSSIYGAPTDDGASMYSSMMQQPISKPNIPVPSIQLPGPPASAPPKAFSPAPAQSSPVAQGPPRRPPTQSNKPAKIRIVMFAFAPQMSDEIELRVGDQVQMDQEFDDGWGTGKNLNTGKEGILPLDCLMGYTTNNGTVVETDKRPHSERMSSLYDASSAGGNNGYGSNSIYTVSDPFSNDSQYGSR